MQNPADMEKMVADLRGWMDKNSVSYRELGRRCSAKMEGKSQLHQLHDVLKRVRPPNNRLGAVLWELTKLPVFRRYVDAARSEFSPARVAKMMTELNDELEKILALPEGSDKREKFRMANLEKLACLFINSLELRFRHPSDPEIQSLLPIEEIRAIYG